MTFDHDYSLIAGEEDEFLQKCTEYTQAKYSVWCISVEEGSILITLLGTDENLENAEYGNYLPWRVDFNAVLFGAYSLSYLSSRLKMVQPCTWYNYIEIIFESQISCHPVS